MDPCHAFELPSPPAAADGVTGPSGLDDLDRLMAYAHALQDAGDPRGELIALQCADELLPSERLRAAARALLRREAPRLLGPELARYCPDGRRSSCGALRLSWRRGFVAEAALRGRRHLPAQLLGNLLASPASRLLAALALQLESDFDCAWNLGKLAAVGHPTLERLSVHARSRAGLSQLGGIAGSLPRLRALSLQLGRVPVERARGATAKVQLLVRPVPAAGPAQAPPRGPHSLPAAPRPRRERFELWIGLRLRRRRAAWLALFGPAAARALRTPAVTFPLGPDKLSHELASRVEDLGLGHLRADAPGRPVLELDPRRLPPVPAVAPPSDRRGAPAKGGQLILLS